jgi:hypothetical protein
MPSNTKITVLKKDKRNANRGNDQGKELIAKSFKNLGAGRSVLADKNMNLIAGNQSLDGAKAAGIKEVIIVETDGSQLVVVKRTDIDIDSKKGRELALADNITAKTNIEFDEEVVQGLADEFDIDLGEMGFDFDLGNGPEFEEDHDENDETEQMEASASSDSSENIFPLAIALTKAEKLKWEKFKKDLDFSNDTDAFKKLFGFAFHDDIGFTTFLENSK